MTSIDYVPNDQWYNLLMTTPPHRIDELLQSFDQLIQATTELNLNIGKSEEARDKQFAALEAQVDSQGRLVQTVVEAHQAQGTLMDVLGPGIQGLMSKMDGINDKVDGIRDDIALVKGGHVKGGHARNAMVRNLPRIAESLGFEFIAEMPQESVIGLSKVAKAQGEAENEVESFSSADKIINIQDQNGQPGYIVLEASFTVASNDIRRAVRNTSYIARYTGLPAYAAVAGVEVLDDAQAEIDAGTVRFYRIQARELQSE